MSAAYVGIRAPFVLSNTFAYSTKSCHRFRQLSEETPPRSLPDLPDHAPGIADPGAEDTHTIIWDFGDESAPLEGLQANHAFAEPGEYNVTVTVTESLAMSPSLSVTV